MCYNIVTMDSFDVNEYSEKSREVLIKVLGEIQEQFLMNGESSQFWFYLNRMEDKSLTEFIVEKWLQALSNKGILHYYKPNYSEWEEAVVFSHKRLEEKYEWNPQMITSYILNRPPDPRFRPSFALDVRDIDLDKLIDLVKKKRVWGKFTLDNADNYRYDGVLLTDINKSRANKMVFGKLLEAEDYIMSPRDILRILFAIDLQDGKVNEGEEEDFIRDAANSTRPSKVISEIKISLRKVSHKIDIEPEYSGRNVSYYKLITLE